MRGGSVSLDESGEVIVYRYVVDADGIDGHSMMTLVGNFFSVTDYLRDEIAFLRDSAGRSSVRSLHRHPSARGYLIA